MKRFVATSAILLLVAVACAISVGWLLAHPIQVLIGASPADLNAQKITFPSDSGANVHGWWTSIS